MGCLKLDGVNIYPALHISAGIEYFDPFKKKHERYPPKTTTTKNKENCNALLPGSTKHLDWLPKVQNNAAELID